MEWDHHSIKKILRSSDCVLSTRPPPQVSRALEVKVGLSS